MAVQSAAPDESAKRMCQSANRFSSTSLMYPWVWPGCLCCAKPPAVFECSRMKAKASVTALRPHPRLWQTSSEKVLISHFCILLICTKHIQMYRALTKSHLFQQKSSVGMESFDFLSALNTLQLLLLRLKLTAIQPDNAKVSWIIDYLTDRPQFVPFWSNILDLLLQWGTVLSPALFAIYLLTRDSTVGQTTSRFSLMIPPLWSASREEEGWWGWLTVCICCMWISVWYIRGEQRDSIRDAKHKARGHQSGPTGQHYWKFWTFNCIHKMFNTLSLLIKTSHLPIHATPK